MPGPVSDSYDPEFGTGANAAMVREATETVVSRIGEAIGPTLLPIVGVASSDDGPLLALHLSEREWRLVRFGLRRALESL